MRRVALASVAGLALTPLALGGIGDTNAAYAQTTGTLTTGYYAASTGTSFTVPDGFFSIQIEAWGGAGSGGGSYSSGTGGAGGGGGFAGGTFSVTSGQVLTILVGGGGSNGGPGSGGTNGGGTAYIGGSGGGYSAVYNGTTLSTANLLVIAGGGGGGGYAADGGTGGAGSAGGSGAAGGTGSFGGTGGGAGTTSNAGAAGTGNSYSAVAGSGMNGGSNANLISSRGGGGGGGYFGGGQGGAYSSSNSGFSGGGGGGAASFVSASASAPTMTGGSGTAAGNNASADYRSGVGVGTAGAGSSADLSYAAKGGDGEVFLRYTTTITSFDYTGSGASGSASMPNTGFFTNGFYYTLTVGNSVSPLTFGGGSFPSAYTAFDNLANAVTTTGLTFTNMNMVTLARYGSSNLLNLVANSNTGAAPAITLNNTGTALVNLDLALNASTVVSGSGSATLAGVISGTGGLTKAGSGTLTLTGANTYSGGTVISGGTLSVNAPAALGTGAIAINGGTLAVTAASTFTNAVTLGSAAGLSSGTVTTANVHTPGLALTGRVTLDSATNAVGLTVTGSSRVAITNAIGEVSGQTTALIKRGAGTLELDEDNTYTGGTLVQAGTLVVNNNYVAGGFTATGSGTGQGAVTVGNGATLTGAYVISGPVQVNSGGTLAVGNSIGTGSVGALTLAGGSVLGFELGADGSTSDRIDVASLLSRSGSGGIDFDLSGEHLADGTMHSISAGTFTLLTFGAANGLTAGDFYATGLPTGWTSTFALTDASGSGASYRPGSLSVVVGAAAPEPTTTWLLLAGIPGALTLTTGVAVRRRKAASCS